MRGVGLAVRARESGCEGPPASVATGSSNAWLGAYQNACFSLASRFAAPRFWSFLAVLRTPLSMEDSRVSFSNARISIEFNRAKQEEQDRVSFSREDAKTLPTYHIGDLKELSTHFQVPDVAEGLDDAQVDAARKTYGKNIVAPPTANPIWMWLGFFFGGFNGFLWFAGALSWLAFGLCYLVRASISATKLWGVRPVISTRPPFTPPLLSL